jgi:hypothetical protein
MGKIGGVEYDADQVKSVGAALGLILGALVAWRIVVNFFEHAGDERRAEEAATTTRIEAEAKARAARDEEKWRPVVEAKRAADALAAADLVRPTAERVTLATAALSATSADATIGICRAHHLLNPIDAKERTSPVVRVVLVQLAVKEAAQLRVERPAFLERRSLLCGDGTTSDCACTGGHRGCCSSHGGVAGCEPLPTAIYCADG